MTLLNKDQVKNLIEEKKLTDWKLSEKEIKRQFTFKDFKGSMAFINKVAAIAESEGHHPDIYVFFNKVTLKLMTHYANGLTENDFILAAKINNI